MPKKNANNTIPLVHSDFTKNKAYELYCTLYDSVTNLFDLYDDNTYYELISKFPYYEVAFPEELFRDIESYIYKNFDSLFENIGSMADTLPDGDDIESIRARNKQLMLWRLEYTNKVKTFGRKYIRPILL